MMDSYATVKLSPWGDVDDKVRLVINQCDNLGAAKTIGTRFEATCRRFLGIRVAPPAALAIRPDIVAAVMGREKVSDREFRQSIRLLAAEVLSTSLAFASKTTARNGTAAPQYSLQNSQ